MASFDVLDKGEFLIVTLPPDVSAAVAGELTAAIPEWLRAPRKAYVFDMRLVRQLNAAVFRSLSGLHRALKVVGAGIYCVNLNKEVARQVSSSGMETLLGVLPTLADALKVAGLQRGGTKGVTMDVNFINPFLGAAKSTVELQAGCKVSFGKPRVKKAEEKLSVDLAGVISLRSPGFSGSVALCFPEQTFLGIYGAMLGEKVSQITDAIQDGAGELLNIIFGQAKAILNDQKGYAIDKALPTVVRGQQLQLHHTGKELTVILPFSCEHGDFHMEIGFEPPPA